MKKYSRRIRCLLLTLVLTAGLSAPAALATEANPPETTPASPTVATPKEPVESEILNSMHVEATAAILVDTGTGTILYEQAAHEQRYPASITKVMTALLTLEAVDQGQISFNQVVTLTSDLYQGIGEGGSTADLRVGEQLSVLDLLYCVLLPSANEACNALAQTVSGSVDAFVELMNQRAQELGMEGTHFTNTHGYHDAGHYTTAYDIYLMCREAMQHETFRAITSSRSHDLPATEFHEARTIYDTNALISSWQYGSRYLYEYATGIKTGSTPEAGYCLASAASKDGRDLIAVVLGAENPVQADGTTNRLQFSESSRLLEWGFDHFSMQTLLDSTYFAGTLPVSLSRETDRVGAQASGTLEALLPNDLNPADFQFTPEFTAESLEAPVEKGQVVGKVTVSNGDVVYGSLELVAVASVERSELLYRMAQIQDFFSQLWVRVVLLVLLAIILVLVLRWLLFGRRRRYSARRKTGYRGNHYSGRRRRR